MLEVSAGAAGATVDNACAAVEIDPAPERVLLALVTSVLCFAVLEAASVATCLTGPPAERFEVVVGGTVTYSVIVAVCASAYPASKERRTRVGARILATHFVLSTQYSDERGTDFRSATALQRCWRPACSPIKGRKGKTRGLKLAYLVTYPPCHLISCCRRRLVDVPKGDGPCTAP